MLFLRHGFAAFAAYEFLFVPAYDDFGQGGPPAPGFGGLGKGGLGSEVEGMAVGMGGGGEPLGFQGEDAPPGSDFHVPGIGKK